jgi:hypothetical protein
LISISSVSSFDASGATAFANAPGGNQRKPSASGASCGPGVGLGLGALKQGAHGFAFVRNDRRDINHRFDLRIVRPGGGNHGSGVGVGDQKYRPVHLPQQSLQRRDILAQAGERNLRGPDTEAQLAQGTGDIVPTGRVGPGGMHEYGGQVLIFCGCQFCFLL